MAMRAEEVDPHWQINVNRQLDSFGKQLTAFQDTVVKRFDAFSVEMAALRRQDDLGMAERQNHEYRLKLLEDATKASSGTTVQDALMNQRLTALENAPKEAQQRFMMWIAGGGCLYMLVSVCITVIGIALTYLLSHP